jgi:endoglycosylceramidase
MNVSLAVGRVDDWLVPQPYRHLGRAVIVLGFLALIVSSVTTSAAYANVVPLGSPIASQPIRPLSTASESSLLSTNGTQITFENGTVVILRGVNLSGLEYIPPVQWAHHESDYATIVSWGFNVVRLPISWENLEPRPGVYDDAYLRLVDQDIAWAKQYGIYIVLDMHQICWSSHFASCNGSASAGIPKWAVSGYPDNAQGIQLVIRDFFSGLGPNGTPPSSTNPSLQARLFEAWKHIASRYKDESTIAGYDVFNEPSSGYYDVDSTFTSTIIPTFYTKAIDAIRTIDQAHICFWEEPTTTRIQRPNVVYSPHYPGLGSLSHYGGTHAFAARIQQIVGLSRKWNVPMFVGEWGMEASAPGVVQYINDSLSLYDSYSISAAWWDYAVGSFKMDLFNSDGTPRQILVRNLVRPFARQVSSPAILATTYSQQIHSFNIDTATGPLQILISIPQGYSVKSVLANTGGAINSQISLRTLLLQLPVMGSKVTVQFVLF